ncbi:ABC transporter permease/M1 family aminopeptidase [Phenylobacterium montanum]|uniref:Aminopeptidase n=1 Tax=Phenylobacterium montanum TaxID=2823693 RepID=A0A975IU01_9CAUL|nr:M1 family aminopeptidase [Caulobacter sp. S6]QUD87288.1 aminopeptidase [Caulobacter sp. S6]
MFGKIAAFEFRYQVRQPLFWVAGVLFFLLTFGAVTSDVIQIGNTANIHVNSPANIAQLGLFMALVYLFVCAAFVANVLLRDDETGFGAIVRATPMGKFDYLYGRFTGAFLAAALGFLVVPLAIFVGSLAPWVDSEKLGPNRLSDYAYLYGVLGVPTVFATSAICFAATSAARSMAGTFLVVIAVFVAFTVSNAVIAAKPELRHVVVIWEPTGLRAYGDAIRYWTAAERNAGQPPVVGVLLMNRVLWGALGLAALAATYPLFQTTPRGSKAAKAQVTAPDGPSSAPAGTAATLPKPVFDGRAAWAQFVVRTRLEMGQVFKSVVFLALMALGLAFSAGNMLNTETAYGAPPYLLTRLAINATLGAFNLFPILIAIFYAGELVWRERDRKTQEIIDASALPDWAFVAPKVIAISLVLISTYLVSVALALSIQVLTGVHDFHLGEYLVWYVLPNAADAILIASLAVFVQAIVPHKFWGWGVMLIYMIALISVDAMGFEDKLYQYGQGPIVPLSDMNGQGHYWIAATWFRAYWSGFALMLLVLSHALWRRGTETRLGPRLRRLPGRLLGPAGIIAGLGAAVFVGTGVFIFLNTHVWNAFETKIDIERRTADHEKAVKGLEPLPVPAVTDIKMAVQVYPHEHRLTAAGTYRLVNRSGQPISLVHIYNDIDADTTIDMPGAHLAKDYPRFHDADWRFDRPLQPGQTAVLNFTTHVGHRGFRNNDVPSNGPGAGQVVDNGTFITSQGFAPQLGVDPSTFLQDRGKRRKYGLTPEVRMAKLEDLSARRFNLTASPTDWVNSDITLTTDADQTPIAPGDKISDATAGGRRTAEFKSAAPLLAFFSIQSARYVEKHEPYKGIDIGVYYDPQHPYNVDRMIAAAKASFDYYQANFSPYQFHQLRFIEFPDYARFAQSFANTVPWSESLGFITDLRDPDHIDYVTYVGAHEIGHQWWAHQLIGSYQQGVTMLDETLAQYSALMVMEKLYGPDKIRRFLKYELDNYLRNRGGEIIEELPLNRVENQPYIHYRKGSLAMYLLKDQIGEDAVNRALRSMLKQYAFQHAPYPRSTDLVAAFRAQAPAGKQALITDLFEKITIYDVKATAVQVKKRPDGRYDVRLTVSAKKAYADGKGKETEVPLNGESFDVGLFTAKPGDGKFGHENVVLFDRRVLHTGVQNFDFVVDKRPAWAGVDPYNKWIDRNSDDNLIQAEKG